MGSTVRIEDEDKARLRRLQEAWSRIHGERLSQKDVLGKGLEFLESHRDAFLQDAGWTPLSEEEIERVQARSRSMGDWSDRSIDETLYGPDDAAGEA